VPQSAIVWGRSFYEGDEIKWFFVARMSVTTVEDVVFGDEGQGWRLMEQSAFLAIQKRCPHFRTGCEYGSVAERDL
jgi:8-oxo-dGTP diphosphatase